MMNTRRLHKLLIASCLFTPLQTLQAGTYIFAGEANGIDIVTHPNTYTGTGGNITVRVCIDPASANAAAMEIPVQNNINIYNRLQPTTNNLQRNANNNVPSNQVDFESVSLHEVGHCLGMAHVNAASESGLSEPSDIESTKSTDGADNIFNVNAGADGVTGSSDDIRGDDVNLHWFRKSNNDPFTLDTVVDQTTYSMNLSDLPAGHNFAANGDRSVAALLGHGNNTETVMQQGTFFDEAQRSLTHDDVATLLYAASGVDEQAGTSDDYSTTLEYGGISNTNCDISLSFTATTGLAFCSVGGSYVGQRRNNHLRVTNANIEFGSSYTWFFNDVTVNQAPLLSPIGDLAVTETQALNLVLTASDADNDNLSYSSSALPAFVTLIDQIDGTASFDINPSLGDFGSYPVTITVTDDGLPALSTAESFTITVAELDSDGDGLGDYVEINTYLTDPNNPDSDGDLIDDGVEVTNGSDPNDANSWPNFADGDLAPLGNPDGIINAADYMIGQRIVLQQITPTAIELSHGDLYPPGSPDGVIGTSDLILLQQLVLP